jgi:hypothetical protein
MPKLLLAFVGNEPLWLLGHYDPLSPSSSCWFASGKVGSMSKPENATVPRKILTKLRYQNSLANNGKAA